MDRTSGQQIRSRHSQRMVDSFHASTTLNRFSVLAMKMYNKLPDGVKFPPGYEDEHVSEDLAAGNSLLFNQEAFRGFLLNF